MFDEIKVGSTVSHAIHGTGKVVNIPTFDRLEVSFCGVKYEVSRWEVVKKSTIN